VGHEVHVEVLAVELTAVRSLAELGAESAATDGLTQIVDAPETPIVEHEDRNLQPLLDGRHDLARVQQIRAVADDDVNLAAGIGEFGADAGGNLVAHARVAVLEMEAIGRPR